MQSGYVTSEGDDLYFEVRGRGPPLLMIPGGGGDGHSYAAIAERLCEDFKVILYDRRAGGRSTMNHPDHFEIAQQSRDAIAVLHATGETVAFVLGNSSGAVIALDIATTYPEVVMAIVAHEPPLARVHPDSAKWAVVLSKCVFTVASLRSCHCDAEILLRRWLRHLIHCCVPG